MQAKFPCPRAWLSAKKSRHSPVPVWINKAFPANQTYASFKQKEIRMGTIREQMMPLKTDITTVSSLVYFKMIGRVVSPANQTYASFKQKEIRMGTIREQMMPLKTDITTVSSLVYFKMIGRVVSSLVAPAEAIQVK